MAIRLEMKLKQEKDSCSLGILVEQLGGVGVDFNLDENTLTLMGVLNPSEIYRKITEAGYSIFKSAIKVQDGVLS
ncbi:MAG: hypothetical protein Q8N88_05350 [Nanoarchaeota archaeon]|nr:hypothetical protein [Nanoarchaeota archaeon]